MFESQLLQEVWHCRTFAKIFVVSAKDWDVPCSDYQKVKECFGQTQKTVEEDESNNFGCEEMSAQIVVARRKLLRLMRQR